MVFESGILTAEYHSEYPEAVERTLNDSTVVFLHTPDMVDDAACDALQDLGEFERHQAEQVKLKGHKFLLEQVPIMEEVSQVIAEWVGRNPRLKRFNTVTGPEFERVTEGAMYPHVDGTGFVPKTGPIGLSIATSETAIWSGERPDTDLIGLFGLESMIKRAKLSNTVETYKFKQGANEATFDLPARVTQKKRGGIWIPNFPNPVIHKLRMPQQSLGEVDEAVKEENRHAVVFDYRMWTNSSKVPPALTSLILDRAA